MRHKNLVIYDSEEMYARNLTEYLSEKREIPFQVRMFHKEMGIRTFAQEETIDVLLTSGDCKCRQEVGAKKIFILTKNKNEKLQENEIVVDKYQSADMILSKILQVYLDEGDLSLTMRRNIGEGQMIGIYSPIHRIGKTKFALEMGKELAKRVPTLYLNLEDYAGIHSYLGKNVGQNLEDLLYYAKQENHNLGPRMSAMIRNHGELDYIHPMQVAWNIRSVSVEEWIDLFRKILNTGLYETLILDIGDSVQGLYEILQQCDLVYTLYTKERIGQEKLKQYEANLLRLGYESILEHTVKQLATRR